MPLEFEADEKCSQITLKNIDLVSFAGEYTPVRIGKAVVGMIESISGKGMSFILDRNLALANRSFTLDENLDDAGLIESVELNWI